MVGQRGRRGHRRKKRLTEEEVSGLEILEGEKLEELRTLRNEVHEPAFWGAVETSSLVECGILAKE